MGPPQHHYHLGGHVLYEGPTYTIWDHNDPDKSLVVGISLDADDELYVAFHVEGQPVLRNAKYKRDGKWNRGDQPVDKRTSMYIPKSHLYGLYDLLGELLEGETARTVVANMETPENNDGMSVNDMLTHLEDT